MDFLVLQRMIEDEFKFASEARDYHLEKNKHKDQPYDQPMVAYFSGRKDVTGHILKRIQEMEGK